MSQLTFAEAEYQNKKRKTRRELFLEKMDSLIPWAKLEKKLRKHYPKGENGNPPYPLPIMLRVHCLQLFYNLSDPAMEDALYEIESMRRFAGLRLSDRLPDESTILRFRHFLERHKLGEVIFDTVSAQLRQQGLMMREGTIVDATIIAAPSSTKNQDGERDPEMHQTKKGNEWHFGMKMHIGVDDRDGLIHSIETTAANVHDLTAADQLLHGEEQRVWGDAGYTGIHKRDAFKDRDVDWRIALRPGTRSNLADQLQEMLEGIKASVRAKVEHPFRTIKQQFGYTKVRYRGLAKNTNRLYVLSAFTNLLRAEKYLPS
ncbi:MULTISPECIES: IS5 family transposase [Spongiibacter]|jgi:IS5 family transposase|uniref:IS5 family transposase n=2 Tax=Spongiibacter TaxID=630749 RepID=A0A7T4URS2_9GAMM|nr:MULTISPECIES: IS5 family transposase [Spongiibacter]MAY37955.1 IS5/IS1182 family transposase [Spongiibacter sp.]MAY40004.1 IS5/IS1182 family transposase [Spongiibacter sp.]MBI58253.1 IS5/IS1182 family transposase [Spongiibacter sp.]MBI58785.1 IS5/IS1182 family transposase [Spongiibacter sp.]MBM7425104.1 IS5 family transposase [Spongiibacter marinus]|tara:strand:- start:235 stop:1182 length:948 start_codon:yes stop_codon:yes gene_type:complete